MGNDQGRPSMRVAKGIVTVNDSSIKIEDPKDDEDLKRLQEIPRFLPILRHSIGRREVVDRRQMSHVPILQLAGRLSSYLGQSAKAVSSRQTELANSIKQVDAFAAQSVNKLKERKRKMDIMIANIEKLRLLNDEVLRVQLTLEELVPSLEVLNEILPPEERVPPLNLGSILERTPMASSSSSCVNSTPTSPSRIPPIDEIKVFDRK